MIFTKTKIINKKLAVYNYWVLMPHLKKITILINNDSYLFIYFFLGKRKINNNNNALRKVRRIHLKHLSTNKIVGNI